MPAGGRKLGCRNKKSRAIIAAFSEFLSPARPVTVRYVLYQLVSRGLVASTSDRDYTAVSNLLRATRVSGEIDDECFIDNHCTVEEGNFGNSNLDAYLRPPDIRWYYRNRWQDQPKHVCEVWLEKNTTAVLLRPTVRRWDCTFRIASGAYGRAFLFQAARDLASVKKQIVILYVGDFDPKGLDIERAARKGNDKMGDRRREGLADILISKYGWTAKRFAKQVKWVRVAATDKDLIKMNDKFKVTVKQTSVDRETGESIAGDTTAPAYVEQYGNLCLEVEALEVLKVGELADRLERAILKYAVNLAAWNRSEAKEREEKRTGVSIP